MHVNAVHKAVLAKMTKPAVVHPGKILSGKLLFSLSIYVVLNYLCSLPSELQGGSFHAMEVKYCYCYYSIMQCSVV